MKKSDLWLINDRQNISEKIRCIKDHDRESVTNPCDPLIENIRIRAVRIRLRDPLKESFFVISKRAVHKQDDPVVFTPDYMLIAEIFFKISKRIIFSQMRIDENISLIPVIFNELAREIYQQRKKDKHGKRELKIGSDSYGNNENQNPRNKKLTLNIVNNPDNDAFTTKRKGGCC